MPSPPPSRGAHVSRAHFRPMEPIITDRGTHLEIQITAPRLRAADAVGVLVSAAMKFGLKPILVICDDPAIEMSFDDAYRVGRAIAERLPSRRIAIALRRRRTSDAEHFIELVAANRGAAVRYFDDLQAAKAWLPA